MQEKKNSKENFLFFILKNPRVYEQYVGIKKGEKQLRTRTEQQIDRLYQNNIRWATKVLIDLITQSSKSAKKLQDITKQKKTNNGIDTWM